MKINIIGGGTSGWWTAGYLRKNHPDAEITLIESPNIPTVGVGESTMPNVRAFFEELNIPEEAWIKSCSGVRKEGNVKTNFSYVGDKPLNFMFIHSGFEEWFEKYKKGTVTKESVYDLYKPNDWRGYAYHIDAAQAWQIVKEYTKDIKHVLATVTRDQLPEADLNIDCTGLGRHLMQDKTMHTYPDTLVDTCIVRRIEEDTKNYSETIGRDYGWEFNVYLSDRRVGCGYVFDSSKINIEDAKKEYMQNNEHRKFLTDFRVLKWEPGRLKTPWQGNTVAVGLSAGFIEPMEANGLSLLIHQIKTLSRVLGKPKADKIYNRAVAKVFDQVADFIWHHYACTTRHDTSFWQHYAKLDGYTTLIKRINDNTNLKTNLYPSYVYAYLAIYFGLELRPIKLNIPKWMENNIYADAYMWSV
jgi:tryptophan halogenase|tara:strand:- start:2697 stop:3938 length:1242 start_codon:yes stop_codon:yes gene_type:complete